MLAPRRHVAQRDAAPRESRAHSPRRGGFLLVLGLLLMVVAAGLGWSALSRSGSTAPARAIGTDLSGNRVALDPGEELTAAQIQAQDAVPDGHGRFQAPSAGLDVALGAMNEVDGVITPPGFSSAYWVRNRGAGPQAPERGTVVVAMHALRGGAVGPGNFLYDPASGDSRVADGTASWSTESPTRSTRRSSCRRRTCPIAPTSGRIRRTGWSFSPACS